MTPTPPDLTLTLRSGINQQVTFDFSRFLYLGVPPKRLFSETPSANRKLDIYRWHRCFVTTNEYSDLTKYGYIADLVKFVRFCDSRKLIPESKIAIEHWERNLVEQVRLGSIKVNTARKLISCTKCLLQMLGHPTKEWFSAYHLFRSEVNPTQSYSDKELKTLIRILNSFFRQLSNQILEVPQKHLSASGNKRTATFTYNGHEHEIASPVTKCFSAAFFLLSYYTWGNSSVLLKMVKPKEKVYEGGKWFEQSVLKPRANKYVSISIGDNGTFHVPKFALRFFEQLLKVSEVISPEQHLLWQAKSGNVAPLEQSHIQTFSKWLQSTFSLVNDDGDSLRPLAKKFRASGSYRYLAKTGSQAETALILGNTPQVISRHYSSGNKAENNNQLLAVTYTLEGVAKCADINTAKEYAKQELAVDILPYDEFLSKYSKANGQKTIIGTGCKNVYGKQAEKYQRRNNFSPKNFQVDHLACSDIHNCFSCENQVIIESVEDIWCLLSYKQSIIDSKALHLSNKHFQKNYSNLIDAINRIIFTIHPKTKRLAEKKLTNEGRHPLWPDNINFTF